MLKVLIVDDIDFNDIAAVQVLKELEVPEIDFAKYCDDALLKIKKAYKDNEPYELLITDLSFKIDYRENILNSGEELIAADIQCELGEWGYVYASIPSNTNKKVPAICFCSVRCPIHD